MELAGRVSEMEAAVVRYWDRVRKRVTIEANYPAKPPIPPPIEALTDAQIMAKAKRDGLLDMPTSAHVR
jgi:hypothetical protein